MFKKKSIDNSEVDTIIGINTSLEGTIQSEATLRIDGNVKGDIKTSGNIFIGPSAIVTGNIFANDIHLSGKVEGNITSKGVLKLLSTAQLFGDISVKSFVADEGGIFQGKCSMVESFDNLTAPAEASTFKKTSQKDYKKSSVIPSTEEDTATTDAADR